MIIKEHKMIINLMSKKDYARELRRLLPKEAFKRSPKRIGWFYLHMLIIATGFFCIFSSDNLILYFLLSLLIGQSMGILSFLGHEIIHGTVVKGKKKIFFFGTLCMFHWGMSANVWIAWHNRKHHTHTQKWMEDPDCFGPVILFQKSTTMQKLQKLTPGSNYKRSYFFLLYWFSFHTMLMIFKTPGLFKSKKEHLYTKIFHLITMIGWPAILLLLNPKYLIFLWLIPLAISNFLMMGYIATNHFLSPSTNKVNDPLVNSLTVRSFKLLEAFHLHNNFHVEHHLFPELNPKYAPLVQKLILERWPDKYQQMSHWKALKMVYSTPRFYKTETKLIDPRTGNLANTLLAEYLD
ncbi:fatty acid desaturase family protein [Sporosarcina limicola]|uniref:Fatty acid desaturase n=1 Tax=Sporosarcina limicola TaxID=34101 RepID=A0A927RFD9_9BACL|nr:fatty acid desaturase [Sporosarcina limicola]MBE1555422.1 fatty acid desaturase [Sporosarcina limicola]